MKLLYYLKIIHSALLLNIVFTSSHYECGTQSIDYNLGNILSQNKRAHNFIDNDLREDYWAPIAFHIVRSSNSVGGVPLYRLEQGIEDLNFMYENTNLHFYQVSYDFIDSDDYLQIDSYDELNELKNTNVIQNSINIYIVPSLIPNENELCGISSFAGNENQGIVMAENCFALPDNPSTLSHEVGHYFNLLHTHTGSSDQDENGIIDGINAEYVDGTECDSRGDNLCDTPADPDLGDLVNSQCEYTGIFVDGHGDTYSPDTSNLMSYSDKICRNTFSDEQQDIIIYTLQELRPELNVQDLNPNIFLSNYNYNSTNGDGDDVLNPGESFELVVNLNNINPWPDASQLYINLSSSNESFIIQNNNQYIDVIESGEIYSNIENPFQVDMNQNLDVGVYSFILNVYCNNGNQYYNKNFELSIPVTLMQSGYPFDTNSQVDSSPLAVDLDGDGSLEVVFGDYAGLVHVLSSDGTPWNDDIFPYDTGNQIWSSPASADIDNDGLMDFVIASKNKHLYGFDQNGLKFDYNADQFLIGTPAIGNIDADDDLEVVIGGYTSSGDVFAVNPDGTDVEGFPVQLNEKIWKGVALHDFNGNGLDDIVVTTDGDDLISLIYDDGTMETLLIADDKFKSSPSIVKSGDDYVIMAGSYDDNMHAVSSTGDVVFTVDTGDHVNSSASFINLNGAVYAFFGSDNGMLYAVDMDGGDLNGWPQNIGESIDNSVSFADLDGDGSPEAIVGASGQLYAYHMDGTMYTHFPISYEFSFTSAPLISDLDQDGDLELVVGSAGSLVSIDIMESGSIEGYWSQDRSDNQKTGFYEVVESECSSPMLGDVNCDTLIDVLDILMMVNTIINESDTTDYQGWASDLNQDGIIDILDVLNIVHLIIN